MPDSTQSVHCYGCAYVFWDRGSDPGWTETTGAFTDFRTGRQFCHDCALCLLWWEYDGMPDLEDPDCSYADWLDIPRVCREAA